MAKSPESEVKSNYSSSFINGFSTFNPLRRKRDVHDVTHVLENDCSKVIL
jgi:hypothetical protein